MTKTRANPRLQFSLRSLLLGVLISAICVSYRRLLLELSFGYFYPFAAFLAFSAWWFGQQIRSRSIHLDSPPTRFSILRVCIPIAVLVCLFSLWLRYRWVVSFRDETWPRSLPYPDEIMLVFHDWLDSKNPAPAGYIKIHGEFYTIWRYLNYVTFGLCTFVGVLLGLACRTSGPIGIEYWRHRIVTVCRKAIKLEPSDPPER